jgi:beta-xylosidase
MGLLRRSFINRAAFIAERNNALSQLAGLHSIIILLLLFGFTSDLTAIGQSVSRTWVSDLRNGTYKNPILHADYSDPDVIRVADDFYMTASSFDAVPGLPILHSKDLVNWTLIGHALRRQVPTEHFEKTQHGNGVWAPAIRYHNNEFYIYYPDPDFGIYLTKAKDPRGSWSDPVLVQAGKGLIDPCPLWDKDGKNYLVHAFAGSRAGIKSVLVVKQLNQEGDKIIDEGKIVYDGHEVDPTIEGPKFYQRNGYYYIFAPAGGVATGWQVVLRSKNVFGPYERKIVLDQGKTLVNGPHQGAWIDTQTGEDWFIHFQDKEAYGRVVHLQPMKWINDWPVIGIDKDGDGKGEPVMTFKKPNVEKTYPVSTPPESDEFNSNSLGLQWQWQANPHASWLFLNQEEGTLRLYSQQIAEAENFWNVPGVLMQKFPAEEFVVTTKLTFKPNVKIGNEKAGIVVMGESYAALTIKNTKEGNEVAFVACDDAATGNSGKETSAAKAQNTVVYFRVIVEKNTMCRFSYSTDGKEFISAGTSFKAAPGKWIGAKIGLFCTRTSQTNDAGYVDIDWFRVEALNNNNSNSAK